MNITKRDKPVKIPKNAKRVFQGVIYDVYHWRQRNFDGSYSTFEMLKRPDTVIVVPTRPNKKIILMKEKQPNTHYFWSFPGGRREPGEGPSRAAARELKEETGYQAEKLELLEIFQPSSHVERLIYTFIGKNCRQVAVAKPDPGEKITLRMVGFAQFLRLADRRDLIDTHLKSMMLRARADKKFRQALYKLMFG